MIAGRMIGRRHLAEWMIAGWMIGRRHLAGWMMDEAPHHAVDTMQGATAPTPAAPMDTTEAATV
jgi:hypothetical protein